VLAADSGETVGISGQLGNRRPVEIDLGARLDDGRILSGEVKWSSRPLGLELHTHLHATWKTSPIRVRGSRRTPWTPSAARVIYMSRPPGSPRDSGDSPQREPTGI
jgi:hypothetical protein